MPRLTPDERAELEARLREDDEDDEDDDFEYGFADGGYVKGKFRRVADVAETKGVKLRKPKPKDGGKDGGKDGDGKDGDAGGGTVKRFQAGRRVG